MTIYAGDLGVEIAFPYGTGDIDASSITSARLFALPPDGGEQIELAVTVEDVETDSLTLVHVTDGALEASGSWVVRAFFYVGGDLVMSSLEAVMVVSARRVSPP